MIPRNSPEFHAFDWGTILEFEVRNGRNQVVDLSGATGVEVLFMRPDGSGFSRSAQLAEPDMFGSFGSLNSMNSGGSFGSAGDIPGSSGIGLYILQPGDLDMPGNWYLQFFVSFPGGEWYSSTVTFIVLPNIISPGEIIAP